MVQSLRSRTFPFGWRDVLPIRLRVSTIRLNFNAIRSAANNSSPANDRQADFVPIQRRWLLGPRAQGMLNQDVLPRLLETEN